MEPLDDHELKQLLRQWEVPAAPAGLAPRVLPKPLPWWKWLFAGTIRIPVPVVAALLAVVVIWAIWAYPRVSDSKSAQLPPAGVVVTRPAATPPIERVPTTETPAPPAVTKRRETASLAGFQPVRQLEPQILREER